MIRPLVVALATYAALGVAGESRAQARCARPDLQAAVKAYLAAQATGAASALPRATPFRYIEQMQDAAIEKGIVSTPLIVDFHRSVIDVEACETFTDKDDWLFNADNYLKYSQAEDWGAIAGEARDTRDTLIAAANAYEDRFSNDFVHTLTVCTIPHCGFNVRPQTSK